MKIAIDIGNTSVTCGLFKKNSLIEKKEMGSLNSFKSFINNLNTNIDKIIISSVVPQLTEDYLHLLSNKFSNIIFLINNKNSKLNLKVNNPSTVGADRLCNIKATIQLYNVPAIIIDFGTATTYDVINKDSEFIGGAIASGVETSAAYLIEKAALLSKTDLEFPEHAIGIDTKQNIQSGIMYGAVDQLEGMINRIKKESNEEYNIIITGGLAKTISPYLSIKHTLDSDLTLKGMILIDESNY